MVSNMHVGVVFRLLLLLSPAHVITGLLKSSHQVASKLLLISFDGMRYDYVDKYKLPNFQRFYKDGARAQRMKSCFTTVTLPNHFSIATGLYEDVHGIVSNVMFDPTNNKTFSFDTADDEVTWWAQNADTVPIWTANQLQGGNRSSGVIGWTGSACNFSGILPDRRLPMTKLGDTLIRTVFDWFTNSSHPANFVALYVDEPDKSGHKEGPDSDLVNRTLFKLDDALRKINEEIDSRNLSNSLNVIIVSDHGMTSVNGSVVIRDYLSEGTYKAVGTTTVKTIYPAAKGLEASIYRNLSGIEGCTVYTKEQLQRYHYVDNARIGPIVLVARTGYLLFNTKIGQQNSTLRGNHGYFNYVDDMYATFLARGPDFKRNTSVDLIYNVDVYPLMVELLQLDVKFARKASKISMGRKGSTRPGSLRPVMPLLKSNRCRAQARVAFLLSSATSGYISPPVHTLVCSMLSMVVAVIVFAVITILSRGRR